MVKKAIQTDGFYCLNVNRKWKWKRREAISSILGKLEKAKNKHLKIWIFCHLDTTKKRQTFSDVVLMAKVFPYQVCQTNFKLKSDFFLPFQDLP